ncbi:MAG: DUF4124 domain-containing protein [Colwellia sp.]|nr:DUF4124 domain-containing protein [Colwellia sp.]
MCISNSAFVAICSAVIFSASATAKDIAIYRWLDENNVVHFSQHEPQNNNYSQLMTFSSYKAKQQATNKPLPSVDEQLTKYEKQRVEILEKNKVIAEKNCKAAQINIKMLNSFSKISILDPDGKNRVLTDKEKQAQVTLSNKHIDLYCNQDSSKAS